MPGITAPRYAITLDGATHTEPFLGETLTEVRFVR